VTKRLALAIVAAPLVVFLLTSGAAWATGSSADPVLGSAVVTVTGTQGAPAAIALALVVGAALVALATGGPGIRRVAGVVLVLAACGVMILAARVVLDPGAAVGRRAAELTGQTGAVGATGSATALGWLALLSTAAAVLGGVFTARAALRWAGLSDRFERDPALGSGPEDRVRSAWDALSEGHDPTMGEPTATTSDGPAAMAPPDEEPPAGGR